MAVFDSERLIKEVELRPVLYNKSLPDYSIKSVKDAIWMEVAEILNDGWNSLKGVEKADKCKEVQSKWKHIRDNFRRELQIQKKITTGESAKKRRKYIFFDQLLFLTPFISENSTTKNHALSETDNEPIMVECIYYDENSTAEENSDYKDSKPIVNRREEETFEDSVLKLLKEKRDEFDEDKYFCLSLVPSLKNLNDESKLIAKSEIINVIRRLTFPESTEHTINKKK